MKQRTLPAICLLLAATTAWGRTPQTPVGAAGVAGFDTNIVSQIHDNGYLRTTATNYGYFGTVRDRLRDSTGAVVPVLESPPHSRIEYIFEAGLWIGGIVDGDTLVSTGSLGSGVTHELYAENYVPGVFSDVLGDDEWTFTYSDSTTEPETVRDDAYDGPHRSLPVKVRQKTCSFDASPCNTALYMEFVVTNIGTEPISDAWIGWHIDPDIGHQDRDSYWSDDITGHVRQSVVTANGPLNVSAAWAMDNDGDPDTSLGQYSGHSATRILGSMYLGGTPPLESESYNWWVPNTVRDRKALDWGPQRAPGDTNVIGGRGAELTDKFRYRLMSNRELDYDQPYAAIDKTLEGWMPPTVSSIAHDYADGFDIRFLHSQGPVTLAPGDSVVVHWVWCVADNPRARAAHFAATHNTGRPDAYVAGLGIESLVSQMAKLKQAWLDDFISLPISPPHDMRVANWDDSTCTLSWTPKQTKRLSAYQIIRSRIPLQERAEVTIWVDPEAGTYFDGGLEASQGHVYTIACVGDVTQSGGLVGPVSPRVSLLPDRPRAPGRPYVAQYAYDMMIGSNEFDDADYESYRVYRREPKGPWRQIGEFFPDGSFIDSEVELATVYEYRLTAVSSLGNESSPGPLESGAVFSFNANQPQILDFTPGDPTSLTDKAAVAAVWMRLLPEARYRDVSTVAKLTLADFDAHMLTIVVSDGRSPLPANLLPLLDVYTKSGVAVVTGRDLFNMGPVLDEFVTLDTSSVGFKAGIRRAFCPRVLLANPTRMNAEFVGADPFVDQLPHVDVDPTRTSWGLNPELPDPESAIPFVGYFDVDTSAGEILYTYVSRDQNSPSNGMPVAVKPIGYRRLAIFSFPLSYIEDPQAKECLLRTLTTIGYGMDRADARAVIDYLFHDGQLPDESKADVNGDGRVDVRDVVWRIDRALPCLSSPHKASARR